MTATPPDNHVQSIRVPILIFAGAVILLLFITRGLQPETGHGPPVLSARPAASVSRTALGLPDLRDAIVRRIRDEGLITVTVHVGLYHTPGKSPSPHAAGDNPDRNLCWGALYGMDTHFANAAGWRRALRDDGDGQAVLARSVFHKKVTPTEHWTALGITDPFDVYVLACAWHHGAIVESMEQPIRAALCNDVSVVVVEGRALRFGSGSVIVGYIGPNHMLEEYWDPLANLGACRPVARVGVFYACPRSAVVLHMPLVNAGVYPVLFTRHAITPEAYVVDGILDALMVGDLGPGFVDSAAAQYARYQKGVTIESARHLFIR